MSAPTPPADRALPLEGSRIPLIPQGAWRREYPFRSRYLERPRGLLHYVDEGTGPPVALVHGNPTWSFLFRALIGGLRGQYRCLAPDHLGMGLSSRLAPGARPLRLADRVADFGAFMDSLKLSEPVHLVVHDWGGPIALGWAVEAPERVASIAFANTGFRPAPGSRLPASLALFQKSSAGANFLARDLGLFTRGLARVGTLRPLRAAAREGLLAPYAKKAHRASVASFISDIPLGPRHPSFATLEKIRAGFGRLEKKPILLLWGLLDFVFDNLFLEDLYRRFPRAALLTLPRAGHWLFEDEPLKILRGLRRFYASTPTAPL